MYLIIQNGFIYPHIIKYLRQTYHIVRSYETDFTTINLNKYDLVIILGGYQSVTKISLYPYLSKLISFINICIKTKIPMLGICLGAQLIAYALGCEIKTANKLLLGYDTYLNDEVIFRNHIDYIVANNKINVTHEIDNMTYYFTYDMYVIGVQSHPDVNPELLDNFVTDIDILNYVNSNLSAIHASNQKILDWLINKLLVP